MAETIHERINRHIAAILTHEGNFANWTGRVQGSRGVGASVAIFSVLSRRADRHKEQLQDLLDSRGGSHSQAKALLGRLVNAAALAPELLEHTEEKTVRQLGAAVSMIATHRAAYEALARLAAVTRDEDVTRLAHTFSTEESGDLDRLQSSLPELIKPHLRGDIARTGSANKLVCLYLDEAIAAERRLEIQVKSFAEAVEGESAAPIFTDYAKQLRERFERLTRRLQSLGEEPSVIRGFLEQAFNFLPRDIETGHGPHEVLMQHLITTYGFVHAEYAALSALQQAAGLAGDDTTQDLAAALQQEVLSTASRVWDAVRPAAEVSIGTMPYAASQ